jgi:hypothetical protein
MDTPASLYRDDYIECDRHGLTIHWYYFPFGDKRIEYTTIRHFETVELGVEGKWRIWGMGLVPHWFHLDPRRPQKSTGILIDDGHPIKVVITPDAVDQVLTILQTHTTAAPM